MKVGRKESRSRTVSTLASDHAEGVGGSMLEWFKGGGRVSVFSNINSTSGLILFFGLYHEWMKSSN